jgi:uncharacterized protein (TIGR03118 family)
MRLGKSRASLGVWGPNRNEHARRRVHHHRRPAALILALGLVAAMAATTPAGANAALRPARSGGEHSNAFRQVNLVSDVPGMAMILDPAVRNPWGIAMGPTTPLWVNNNFNPASDCGSDTCIPKPEDLLTKITLYRGANGVDPISKVPLEVTASSPTGMVFNPSEDFVINQDGTQTPARFIFNETFVDPAGTAPESMVTGWSPVPAPVTHTTPTAAVKDPALPFGLALVPASGTRGSRLLVADGISGGIDIYDSHFNTLNRPRRYVDPNAAGDGLAAYNVTFLQHKVYVAYFANSGGAVSVFTPNGRFLKRLFTGAPLVGPWGMAIAPNNWGRFGGALLVGNVDDGLIHAFNLSTGALLGTVRDAAGKPIVNPGIWGLAFGNGVIGTPRTLLFSAGVGSEAGGFGDDVYTHGLVGMIEPVGRHDEH